MLTTRRLITCKGQGNFHFSSKSTFFKKFRIITLYDTGPGWLKSMIGASYFYFLEETTVDPRTMKMVLASSNVSFSEIIKVEEVCTYTPHPENNKWTHFNQTAKFTAFPFGIKGSIESVCMDKFKKNAEKGREIMEQAILTLNQERKRVRFFIFISFISFHFFLFFSFLHFVYLLFIFC